MSLIVLLSFLTGCSSFHRPRFDVGERTLLVIPFRDLTAPRNTRWYGESARGIAVVRYFMNWAEKDAVGRFAGGPGARRVVAAVRDWLQDEIRASDWRKLLTGVDADLVLIGEITEFNLKQPSDVNIYRGSAKMEYRLIDAATGRTVDRTPSPREVSFPEPEMANVVFDMDVGQTKRRIEEGLRRALGERLGKDLYGYYGP